MPSVTGASGRGGWAPTDGRRRAGERGTVTGVSDQHNTSETAAGHHLVQLNVGRLRAPLDDPSMAEFAESLGPINALAESSPGFVWRLVAEDGSSSSYVDVPGADDPLLAVNYSIWTDLESLRGFVFRSDHTGYLRRRREWFAPIAEAITVCWWVPAGEIPPLAEAMDRLDHLRRHGPSDQGWPMTRPYDPPEGG